MKHRRRHNCLGQCPFDASSELRFSGFHSTRPKRNGKRRVKDNAPYHHAGNLLLHPLTGKTGRIIPHRKIKYKREFVIDYWRIGGLGDWRIGGLGDWRIGGLGDWRIGGLED